MNGKNIFKLNVPLVLLALTFILTGCPDPNGDGGDSTKTLSSIAVKTKPAKTTYAIGESLNLAGLVITATYSDDSAADISDTAKFTPSGFNSSAAAASQTVTVSYTEGDVTKMATFTVTISAAQQAKTLSSIAVKTSPTKTAYVIGESLSLAGLVITATYSDASTADISDTTKFTSSGFNSSTAAASQTVTVSYTEGGVTKTATFTVTISAAQQAKTLSSIAIKTPPTKTTYAIGESLSLAGLVITATYSDASTADISDTTKFTSSGFNSSAAAASQTVTVSYTEGGVTKTATITVTISTTDVDKTFTLGYERGTVIVKDADGNEVTSITLSKSGTPSSVSLSVDGTFTGVTWYVDDVNIGTGGSLILDAANYTAKNHSVTFTSWRNGSYLSSGPIPFTVEN
jgi:predicted CoA-binding protein